MKTLNEYLNPIQIITENKITEIFKNSIKSIKDKVANKFNGHGHMPSDAIKKLPAECVLRIAVTMCALLKDKYYKALPNKQDAKAMWYDTPFLRDTLRLDWDDEGTQYLDEVLRIMQACYLGANDVWFAHDFNEPVKANATGWTTMDNVVNYKH